MGYNSDVALQFISQEEADKFIDDYKFKAEELSVDEKTELQGCDLFIVYDKKVTNQFGEVTYIWKDIKFYSDFYWIRALEIVFGSQKYTAKFIRIGEAEDDIEISYSGNLHELQDSIWVRSEIDYNE